MDLSQIFDIDQVEDLKEEKFREFVALTEEVNAAREKGEVAESLNQELLTVSEDLEKLMDRGEYLKNLYCPQALPWMRR